MAKQTQFKNVVITGAASGIGKALVEQMAKQGAHVYAIDLQAEKLQELGRWSDNYDYSITIQKMDITDSAEVQSFVEKLSAENIKVDTWINSAGVSGIGEFEKLSEEEFEKVLEINLLSIIRISRFVLKHMKQNGFGKIVNISSVAGFVPSPLMSAYSLSKHALIGFTRSMHLEMQWCDSPVEFVLVCPGFVETEMIKKGQEKGFPEWLSPLLANPNSVAEEIVMGLKKGKKEIYPTWNGKALLMLHKHFPDLVTSQARMLTTKSFKDFILNRN